jgi:hypothetical protein
LVLELRTITETGRLVVVVMTRLVIPLLPVSDFKQFTHSARAGIIKCEDF